MDYNAEKCVCAGHISSHHSPGRWQRIERSVKERKVRLLPPPQLITRDMEMEKDLRFLELKQELLNRAHKANACKEQYL